MTLDLSWSSEVRPRSRPLQQNGTPVKGDSSEHRARSGTRDFESDRKRTYSSRPSSKEARRSYGTSRYNSNESLWTWSRSMFTSVKTELAGNQEPTTSLAGSKTQPGIVTRLAKSSSSSFQPTEQGPRHARHRSLQSGKFLQAKDALAGAAALPVGNKRRCSEENADSVRDQDVIVYVHVVQPSDTLAGIAIKYDCPQNVLQKTNRLWPQDSVQTKRTMLLPLAACGVKGRRVNREDSSNDQRPADSSAEPPKSRSLLGMDNGNESECAHDSSQTTASVDSNPSEQTDWTHESWMLIDGFPALVQLARLSARALGYFPPPRRKSAASSEGGRLQASIDWNLDSSAGTLSCSPDRSDRGTAAKSFQRSGGVGTMQKNVHKPGPANDGLNNLLQRVVAQNSEVSSPSLARLDDVLPAGLEEVGASIETWFKKLTLKASSNFQGPIKLKADNDRADHDMFELTEDLEQVFELQHAAQPSGRSRAPD